MGLLAFYVFCALCCLVCLVALYSSSEDAISRPKKPLALAPPWAWILLGIRCFGTMPHRAPQGLSMGLLAFYVFCALCCLVCLVAFYLAVPKMLFRDHLFACRGTALDLNPAGDPVFRNHAPPCSTRPFHGPSSLLCLPWLVLPCLPCSLLFSSSEDAISRPKKPLALAPPWAWILLGIRCFGTMPHRAPQGLSMGLLAFYVFCGLCCLVCLVAL